MSAGAGSTLASDDPRAKLAAELQRLQIRSGKSLRELAGCTLSSDSALSRYLSGQVVPQWPVIESLCRIGDGDIDALRRMWRLARSARIDERIQRAIPSHACAELADQAEFNPEPEPVTSKPEPEPATVSGGATDDSAIRARRWAAITPLAVAVGLVAMSLTLMHANRHTTEAGSDPRPSASHPVAPKHPRSASPSVTPGGRESPGRAGGQAEGHGAGMPTSAAPLLSTRAPVAEVTVRSTTTVTASPTTGPSAGNRQLMQSGTGECLAADYANVYMIPCDDVLKKAQTWRRIQAGDDRYMLEGGIGRCLSTLNLDRVQTIDCASGDPGLLWTWDSASKLWSVSSGRSLVADFAHQVYLYQGDGAGQTWTLR